MFTQVAILFSTKCFANLAALEEESTVVITIENDGYFDCAINKKENWFISYWILLIHFFKMSMILQLKLRFYS